MEGRPLMTKADRIRSHVGQQYVEPARRRGDMTITVVAGAVLRDLQLGGDYAASVCSALRARKFLKDNNLELVKAVGPKSMMSTTTAFTYRLLQRAESGRRGSTRSAVWDLLGAGRDTFAALGGGERWLREERESFYGGGNVNDEADPPGRAG